MNIPRTLPPYTSFFKYCLLLRCVHHPRPCHTGNPLTSIFSDGLYPPRLSFNVQMLQGICLVTVLSRLDIPDILNAPLPCLSTHLLSLATSPPPSSSAPTSAALFLYAYSARIILTLSYRSSLPAVLTIDLSYPFEVTLSERDITAASSRLLSIHSLQRY